METTNTNQTTFLIDPSVIQGMLNMASVKDIRYCPNGLLFEVQTDQIIVVATDGHKLGAYRIDDQYQLAPCSFIMPSDFAKKIKGKYPVLITYSHTDSTITVNLDGSTHTTKAVDGKFPEWRRVIPSKVEPGDNTYPAQFNVDYLTAIKKAVVTISGSKWAEPFIHLQPCEYAHDPARSLVHKSAVLTYGESFIAVLMPLIKMDKKYYSFTKPGWMETPEMRKALADKEQSDTDLDKVAA